MIPHSPMIMLAHKLKRRLRPAHELEPKKGLEKVRRTNRAQGRSWGRDSGIDVIRRRRHAAYPWFVTAQAPARTTCKLKDGTKSDGATVPFLAWGTNVFICRNAKATILRL